MRLVSLLYAGVSLTVLASPALAQTVGEQAGPQAPGAVAEVVVTGSRIMRNGYSAPTPVTVASAAQLDSLAPSSIADGLNKLPVFNGSASANAFTNGTGVSGSFLNLRSFGINRTLVLMDGIRVPPSGFSGQVDTNTIPQQLVQRVDVVTGGASAVYGSDAVTGVVNYILDTHYSGFKGVVQGGVSGHDDAGSYRVGLAGGTDVLSRGHVIASYEHFEEGGLIHEDRNYGLERPVYVGAAIPGVPQGTTANPLVQTYFATIATTFDGVATSGPFKGQQFVANGSLAPYNQGSPTGSSAVFLGGDGAYFNREPLYAPQDTDQLFGRFQYELTDKVTGYVQATDSRSQNKIRASNSPIDNLTIFSGNPYLPAAAQAALTGTGALANPQFPSFTMSRVDRDLNLDSEQVQQSGGLTISAGLTGQAFGDFKWNANYTRGQTDFRQHLTNNINAANYLAALDAVTASDGSVVCRVTLTNPGLYPGCAPLNLFGAHNESAAAKAFIYQTTSFHIINTVDDYEASISGTAFRDWAGPVSVAFNAEYRQQGLRETTSASPLTTPSFVGIRAGALPRTVYQYNTVAPTAGSNSVGEASLESVVPLLKDQPFAIALDVNGAYRYTNYSSSGGVNTWKIGIDYQPVNELRFRATESQDIRAPTLFDLYAGQSTSVISFSDLHTNGGGTATQQSSGNPNLTPEVSKTFTGGLIYSPVWLSPFRISIDYYDISIKNAITAIQANQQQIQSECEGSGGVSPLCQLYVRPGPFSDHSLANTATLIKNESLNIAQNYTRGVDIEASYLMDLRSLAKLPGAINWRLLYSYQPVYDQKLTPNSVTTNLAGVVGLASNRATVAVGYELGAFSFDWQTRYSGPEGRTSTPLTTVIANPKLPGIYFTDINIAYRFKAIGHDLQAFLNIGNLFDQQPRIAANPATSSTPGLGLPIVPGDDGIGRYYTMGVRFRY